MPASLCLLCSSNIPLGTIMLVGVAKAGDIESVRALQTRQILAEGNSFVSVVSFRRAGPFDVTADECTTAPAP